MTIIYTKPEFLLVTENMAGYSSGRRSTASQMMGVIRNSKSFPAGVTEITSTAMVE